MDDNKLHIKEEIDLRKAKIRVPRITRDTVKKIGWNSFIPTTNTLVTNMDFLLELNVGENGKIMEIDKLTDKFGENYTKSYEAYYNKRDKLLEQNYKGKWVYINENDQPIILESLREVGFPVFRVGYEICE